VPTNDLSLIPDLEDKHLRALARQQITDLRSLTDADRSVIYRAMANIRPRPTLERISQWQDDARSMLDEAVIDASDWHTAASFAVVFAQRRVGDTWQRRVEAERTEVEPERESGEWAGWDCEPVCGWMLRQLGQADSAELESGNGTAAVPAQPEGESAGEATWPVAAQVVGRAQLRIETAAIIDATSRTDVVMAGAVVESPPAELVAPVRVVVTVSGAQPRTEVQAVTRVLRRDRPGWNPQDPVVVPRSGQAEFDLSGVPAGQHKMSLVAWAPDATAKPVSLRLPAVTILSSAS
jgi:hypothetical protein